MSTFICEICKTSVSTKYVLKNHMETNKTCLAMRNLELKTKFSCNGCSTCFLDVNKLNSHQECCKLYQKDVLSKEMYIEIKKEFNYQFIFSKIIFLLFNRFTCSTRIILIYFY